MEYEEDDPRSSRYTLGYEVAQIYGLLHPEVVAVDRRSEEFQQGFWDSIGDQGLSNDDRT